MVKSKPGVIAAVAAGTIADARCLRRQQLGRPPALRPRQQRTRRQQGRWHAERAQRWRPGGPPRPAAQLHRRRPRLRRAFLHRSLTTYATGEGKAGTKIVADLATDTGTPDATGKVWNFTLRDGITFEDGTAVTCDDVKYGVSRSFAQDVITDGPTVRGLDARHPEGQGRDEHLHRPVQEHPGGRRGVTTRPSRARDGKTITFNLDSPFPDFNGTTTLLTFSPVPKAKDTGEKYDMAPVSERPVQDRVVRREEGAHARPQHDWNRTATRSATRTRTRSSCSSASTCRSSTSD